MNSEEDSIIEHNPETVGSTSQPSTLALDEEVRETSSSYTPWTQPFDGGNASYYMGYDIPADDVRGMYREELPCLE